MSILNPNCDGSHCREKNGEVRVFPLGTGSNLILCRACFAYENQFRFNRSKEMRDPNAWPQVNWATVKPYPQQE